MEKKKLTEKERKHCWDLLKQVWDGDIKIHVLDKKRDTFIYNRFEKNHQRSQYMFFDRNIIDNLNLPTNTSVTERNLTLINIAEHPDIYKMIILRD